MPNPMHASAPLFRVPVAINAGLPEVLDDGNRYVYGAGLESMVTPTGSYYYLADGLGSTMAIADSTGMVAKSYTYDVYG
ncbi:MAG: hypothetical protein L6Q80_03760 [Dehalococcoidia bacterium]|nr:hypothetical protein [Dehalococcoidia bacterium]